MSDETKDGTDERTAREVERMKERVVRRHVEGGLSMAAAGEPEGISREYARQIIRDAGVTPERSRRIAREARVEVQTCALDGCDETWPATTRVERDRKYCSDECRAASYRERRVYTDEELLDHLRRLAADGGRTPSMRDIRAHSPPAHTVYFKRFGSLTAAQEAAGLPPNEAGQPARELT